jgi:hypothetical protein
MMAYMGSEGIDPSMLNLCTSWSQVVNTLPRPQYFWGESLQYQLTRRLGGFRTTWTHFAEEKHLLPLPGLSVASVTILTTLFWLPERCGE